MVTKYTKEWRLLSAALERKVNVRQFKEWLEDLQITDINHESQTVYIGAKDEFIAAVVHRRYIDVLNMAAWEVFGRMYRAEVTFAKGPIEFDEKMEIKGILYNSDFKPIVMILADRNVSDEYLTQMGYGGIPGIIEKTDDGVCIKAKSADELFKIIEGLQQKQEIES